MENSKRRVKVAVQDDSVVWTLVRFIDDNVLSEPIKLHNLEDEESGQDGATKGLGEGDLCLAPYTDGQRYLAKILRLSENKDVILKDKAVFATNEKSSSGMKKTHDQASSAKKKKTGKKCKETERKPVNKNTKQKNMDKPNEEADSKQKKKAPTVSAEKMAEMAEMLGIGSHHEPVAKSSAVPSPKKMPVRSSPRKHKNANDPPPSKNDMHLSPSPRRMPAVTSSPGRSRPTQELFGVQDVHCPDLHTPIEDPTSSWEGTFVGTMGVLLDLDRHDDVEMTSTFATPASRSHEACTSGARQYPEPLTVRSGFCEMLGITKEEAATTKKVLQKIITLLGDDSPTQISSYQESVINENTYNQKDTTEPSQQEPVYVVTHQNKTPEEKKCQLIWRCSFCMCIHSYLSFARAKTSMLIKDPSAPERYKNVLVNKGKERQALLLAKSAKFPAKTLLNGIVSCVFTMSELASSSGLGIRSKKGEKGHSVETACVKPLDSVKIDAIRDYVQHHARKEGWEELTNVNFNTIITNKVTNARKKLLKRPTVTTVLN